MDRRRKVELFEQIRREYRFGVGTIRGVAKQFGVHRRIVRQALASALPPERKTPTRTEPKLESVKAFIDDILRADQQGPRKQRHTAHRIWVRIIGERPEAGVAESTVRHYVVSVRRTTPSNKSRNMWSLAAMVLLEARPAGRPKWRA
jgi:hypothetical protein